MRQLTISIFMTLIFNYSFSQTKIIAFKSHSGNILDFDANTEIDNFGELPEMRMIQIFDTVKVISDSQFVEIWHFENPKSYQNPEKKYYYKDTNIISPNYRSDTKIIQQNYPSNTVFEQYVAKKKVSKNRKKNKPQTNNLWLLVLILGGSLTPFIVQFFKKPLAED